ncbi:MAG: 1-acyl-sn-glycerol-3-phosphate acyltransferase [Tepidisphaera sp.]
MQDRTWTYKPAADHGLPPAERIKSVRREPGFLSILAHHAATGVLRTHFTLYNRLEVVGKQYLPTKPPFVMISNHQSHIDAPLLSCILPRLARAHAYPVAAGDVFFKSLAHSVLSSLFINALPIWRKKVTTHALFELRERLLEGDSGFIIFPEGTRSRDGQMGSFKPGLGMLVAGTNVPVIPCHIAGAFESMPADKFFPRPHKMVVSVGPPLTFPDAPDAREGWERVAKETEAAVRTLKAAQDAKTARSSHGGT